MKQEALNKRENQSQKLSTTQVDANWEELNKRTAYNDSEYNSMALLGSKLKTIISHIETLGDVDLTGKLDKDGYTGSAQDLKDLIDGIVSGIRGDVFITDTPTADGYYNPNDTGVYTNFGGLSFHPLGVDAGKFVLFLKSGVNYSKIAVDLNIQAQGVQEPSFNGDVKLDKVEGRNYPIANSNITIDENDSVINGFATLDHNSNLAPTIITNLDVYSFGEYVLDTLNIISIYKKSNDAIGVVYAQPTFTAAPTPNTDIDWENETRAFDLGGGSLEIDINNATAAWTNGALSSQAINGNNSVKFKLEDSTESGSFGLTNTYSGISNSFSSIDYWMLVSGGANDKVLLYENGTLVFTLNGWVVTDEFEIALNGATVTYLVNGVVIFTSSQTPVLPLNGVGLLLKASNFISKIVGAKFDTLNNLTARTI